MIQLRELSEWNLSGVLNADLTVQLVWAGIGAVTLIFGIVAWLKGRRIVAVFVWLTLVVAALRVLGLASWIDDLADEDAATVDQAIAGAVMFSALLGLIVGFRLAKPSSWWAQRRYSSDKYSRAVDRYGWSKPKAR